MHAAALGPTEYEPGAQKRHSVASPEGMVPLGHATPSARAELRSPPRRTVVVVEALPPTVARAEASEIRRTNARRDIFQVPRSFKEGFGQAERSFSAKPEPWRSFLDNGEG